MGVWLCLSWRCPLPRGSLGRCESLVEVYFQLHQQVTAASTELGPELQSRLLERFSEVLSSLVKRYWAGGSWQLRVGGNL